MSGAQVVFPEAEFTVTVKDENDIKPETDVYANAANAEDEIIDVKSDVKTDQKDLFKKVPPLPPRLGPLKMKKKDLRYSPYQDGWKMNPRALPLISREDDPFIYLRPPDTTVPSATATQEDNPAICTNAHVEDHLTDNEKASARVLSKFESLFGKPLFPINEINLYPTKPKEKIEKRLVMNPLANAFGGPPIPVNTAIFPSRRRRATSPSLLVSDVKEPSDEKVASFDLTSPSIREGRVDNVPTVNQAEPNRRRRAASPSLLAGTDIGLMSSVDEKVDFSNLTPVPIKKELFDNSK